MGESLHSNDGKSDDDDRGGPLRACAARTRHMERSLSTQQQQLADLATIAMTEEDTLFQSARAARTGHMERGAGSLASSEQPNQGSPSSDRITVRRND